MQTNETAFLEHEHHGLSRWQTVQEEKKQCSAGAITISHKKLNNNFLYS